MEDGWRLYYAHDKMTMSDEIPMLFKSLQALKQRQHELAAWHQNDNLILEDPVPVLLTKHGIEDIRIDDYIIMDSEGNRFLLAKEDFENLFEENICY